MCQPRFVPRLSSVSTIIIPARLASTRLPRKLLLRETGKSLLQHTYEAAGRATLPSGIIVAADDEEIAREVRSFGGRVVLTDPALPSGTDRVAAVARDLPDVDIVVNVQGDEPELSGEAIDAAVLLLEKHPEAVMSTLATPIRRREQLEDPACVKVVFDRGGRALYFSRSVIPHPRQWDDVVGTLRVPNPNASTSSVAAGLVPAGMELTANSGPQGPGLPVGEESAATDPGADTPGSPTVAAGLVPAGLDRTANSGPQGPELPETAVFFQHVGLYAYRREFLLELAAMPPSRLEQIEKLEQLRVLEAGYSILVATIDEPTVGIDTPADYRAFVERCRNG